MTSRFCTLVLAAALGGAPGAAATEFVINNVDPPGIGFNDPTPVAPVGGNTGTTIGEQRMIAFEFATELWGVLVLGTRNIVVRASFGPLSCSSSSAVLGAAAPESIHSDFAGAPQTDTWYVAALANEGAGSDLNGAGSEELRATFNGDLDNNNNCLNNRNWYYGLDNDPPGNDIDFLNVLMHEIAHGLGFFSLTDLGTGNLPSSRPDVFARLAMDASQGLTLAQMNDAQRAQAVKATGDLVWTGASTTAYADIYLDNGVNGDGYVRLFAPNPVQPGSSVAHFDTVASPSLLMEPVLQSNIAARVDVDLTANFMADIGWYVPDTDFDLVTDINDNCAVLANTDQIDADQDYIGNRCDPDFNNDLLINAQDLGALRSAFFSSDPVADLNGDGVVNTQDLGILRSMFFGAPGPSGINAP